MQSKRYIVRDYLNCERCGLCKFRKQIVFGRGTIPAKILFIGEAPGKTEDLIGVPFIGQAGRLLDRGIDTACQMAELEFPPSYFITNTVACRPTDMLDGENRPPTPEEAWRCFERLKKTYQHVKPARVVFLGKVAKRYCSTAFPEAVELYHPAYLLRCGGVEAPAFRSFCRNLSEVFREVSQ